MLAVLQAPTLMFSLFVFGLLLSFGFFGLVCKPLKPWRFTSAKADKEKSRNFA